MRRVAWILFATSLFVSSCRPPDGCECNHLGPTEVTLDFKSVFVGEHTQQQMEVTLDGRSSTPLKVRDGSVPDGFVIDLGNGTVLNPGLPRKVTVTFAPTARGEFSGDAVLEAANTDEKTVVIHLHGVGKVQDIDTDPQELDFGVVRVGNAKTLSMVVLNYVGAPEHVGITSDDPAFTIEPDTIDLVGGGAATIDVTFRPAVRGGFNGPHLHFALCANCEEVRRTVRGVAAIEDFSLSPTPLDFGTHSPGSTACQDVTLRNTGDVPIKFFAVTPDPYFVQSGVFDLQVGNLLDGTTQLEVKWTTTVSVCFTPDALARDYNGGIGFNTLDNNFRKLRVRGRGGGSEIVCTPDHVDFGVVTPSSPVTKQVVCTNLGEPVDVLLRSVSADPSDSLRLDYTQDGAPAGFNLGREDFHFGVALIASAGVPGPTINLAFGRPGVLPSDTLQIPVTGGTVLDQATCNLSVRPLQVNFGLVNDHQSYSRKVQVVNDSPTDECFVWDFGLDPTESDRFTVTGAPEGVTSIPAAGTLSMTIVYDPQGASILADTQDLTFKMAVAAGDPTVKVPISGFATHLDLSVQPDPVDFGSIPPGYEKQVAVNLINHSLTPIEVTTVDSSTAFGLANVPELPTTVPGGGQLTFEATFAPTAPGDYEGELAIELADAPAPILVPLLGNAATPP